MCITIFNESFTQLKDSLTGILRNVAELDSVSRTRFKDSVAIAIVADGFESIPLRFLSAAENARLVSISAMEEFFEPDEDAMRWGSMKGLTSKRTLKPLTSVFSSIYEREHYEAANIAHVFHNKLNLSALLNGHLVDGIDALTFIEENVPDFKFPVVDVFFCIKHTNAGKIESHLWFFKGLCGFLEPEMCQLVDVGTVPLPRSISTLFLYMDRNSEVGGCCGEIEVMYPERPDGVVQVAMIAA